MKPPPAWPQRSSTRRGVFATLAALASLPALLSIAGCPPHDDGRGASVIVPLAATYDAGSAGRASSAPTTAGSSTRVEVSFADGSSLHAEILEDGLDFTTRYGRLRVPLSALRSLEIVYGSEGHADVLETEEMRLIGTLEATTLRARTAQFGDQPLKLSDVRSIRALTPDAPKTRHSPASDPTDAPTTLSHLDGSPPGTTARISVTGGAGAIYGSGGVYSTDSVLGACAVHSGMLRMGETSVIEVELLGDTASFTASTKNGVTSLDWPSPYPSFRIRQVVPRRR